MRPNTPHMVFTPESAICHGGHFYATSTIQPTIFGIYHTFSASGLLTNTEHTKGSRLLLRRLMIHIHYVLIHRRFDPQHPYKLSPHVPDPGVFETVVDLFMFCVFMELGDLLNPKAYKRQEKLCHNELVSTMYARGLTRELIDWWHKHYEFTGQDERIYSGKEFFQKLFSHQVRTLVTYKRWAEKDMIDTDEAECTSTAFESWLLKCHGDRLADVSSNLALSDTESLSFAWPGERCEVRVKAIPASSYNPSKSFISTLFGYCSKLR